MITPKDGFAQLYHAHHKVPSLYQIQWLPLCCKQKNTEDSSLTVKSKIERTKSIEGHMEAYFSFVTIYEPKTSLEYASYLQFYS
jgi:hypothetical protein